MKTTTRWAALVAFVLAGFPAHAQAQETATFTQQSCGVSFQHPKSWDVVPNPARVWSADYAGDDIMCTFGLRPPGWTAKRRADSTGLLREFPVHIAIIRRPFLEVAHRAGFSQRRANSYIEGPGTFADLEVGDWAIAVRQGESPAEQFKTSCCQAVIGDTWGNTVAADGSKATVTATIAVVNDRRRHSAVIEGWRTTVEQVATSIRFSH